jgi:hypothetical protein
LAGTNTLAYASGASVTTEKNLERVGTWYSRIGSSSLPESMSKNFENPSLEKNLYFFVNFRSSFQQFFSVETAINMSMEFGLPWIVQNLFLLSRFKILE